jgi:phenylalanyl-tRNA synthetase beta chain
MKISLRWLSDYIDINDYFAKPADLSALLTGAGLEVESIENLAKNFDHVVIGHILKKEQHPGADRLTLCQISTGEGVVHQIVCGAKNHSEGDNVVVALPGAVLPGNFAIKQSKIRGVDSGGMLCSTKELGLPDDGHKYAHDGIMILPKDAPVGKTFAEVMGLDDILFDLKVTANRADCLSHFGLAREVACLLGREVKFPIESIIESASEKSGSTRDQIQLTLNASDMCPRYTGRGISGVKVGHSPAWLQKRLESVGMKSINNVVDATNFVMMELGQPLHAFDAKKILGKQIIVDRARAGEKFTTLDGTELALTGDELTIRDAERAVVLAGVIGGKNSGVDETTTEIFLEAAFFLPSAIRRTARKFGIETDSSYRFARGTNPEAVLLALNRAAQIIQKVAGGEIMGEPYDLYPNRIAREPIAIDLQTLRDRLGFEANADEFVMWMKRLGCETKESHGHHAWSILPPVFRWDLVVDMDLIEEFARLHGYQHIPESIPALAVGPATNDLSFVVQERIRRILQGEGCLQAINYAFLSEKFQSETLGSLDKLKALGLRIESEAVKLMNPLNDEIAAMRTSLMPGLIKNLTYNSRNGNPVGRLFEIGFGHFRADGDYPQEARLGFAFWGSESNLWSKSTAPAVMTLKGAIENLLKQLGFAKWKWVPLDSATAPDFVHPGQASSLMLEGKSIGFIGTLHPTFALEQKVRESSAVGELLLDRLVLSQPRPLRYQPISKMPTVDRDLAFVMPKSLAVQDVENEIKKVAGDLLKEIRVFDVYEGAGLQPGQRSVAFRLLFQSKDATLEDAQINEIRDRAVKAAGDKFGIALR